MDIPREFYNMRTSGIMGVIEFETIMGKNSSHFSEWWSGEGADLEINGKHIQLHMDEFLIVVAVAQVLGMVDDGDVERIVNKLKGNHAS